MVRMLSLRAVIAWSVCLLPVAAFAQSGESSDSGAKPTPAAASTGDNSVTVGSQYNSSRSDYLGRYTGVVNKGFYGLGDFHLGERDPWDSGGTSYWDAQGDNLGFDSRSFSANVGDQGTWGLSFYYAGIPYDATDSFKSIYQGNGSLVSGLAPASLGVIYNMLLPKNGIVNSLWIPGATNSPAGLLNNFHLSTQRDIFGGTGKYQWQDWTITGAVEHQHKGGLQASSAAIGGTPAVTTAGSGAAAPTTFTSGLVSFAQPIDYDMDRYDVSAARTTERMQMQFGYTYSRFTDNSTVFTAANPFAFTPTTSFGGPASNLSAIYVLPPSNSAHQLKAAFGYNLTPTMRLNANFGFGLQMQNAPFQSGIGDTNVPLQTLPRSSFDGLMRTSFGNVALTAQPLTNVDLRFAYTMDDRDNESTHNLYTVFPTSASATSFNYYNLPFSFQDQKLSAEAGYRLEPQTKVTLNDTFDYTHRSFTDASVVTSNRVSAKIRSSLADWLFGSFSVAYEDRVAHNYNPNGWWAAACSTCNSEPSNFLMFFEASRQREEVKGTLDLSPTHDVTATLMMKFANDSYPDDSLGMRNNQNLSVGPDVSWEVSKSLNAHAYYTYQRIYYNQSSIYESSTTSAPDTSATGTGFIVPWTADTTDTVHTVGVNLNWQAIEDVLKFSLDYNLSYGDTAYALGDGVVAFGGAITTPTFQPSINMQPLPDVKSTLSVISLRGEYKLTSNMALLFGYSWERFIYKDFMIGNGATQFANALLSGTPVPKDSVHVINAGLRFRF